MDDLNECIARRFLTGSWIPIVCFDEYQLALNNNKQHLAELELDRNFRVTAKTDDHGTPVDLDIGLGEGQLTQEQAELVIEVKKALTVISVVFAGRSADDKQRRRQGEYVIKLHDILFAGLFPPLAPRTPCEHWKRSTMNSCPGKRPPSKIIMFGNSAFARRYPQYFFVRLHRGFDCCVASGNRSVCQYCSTHSASPGRPACTTCRTASALGSRTSIGTWLSFSLRRPVLGFADLAVLEEDRLNPTARILFVLGLTLVVGLLIYTKLVAIKVGEMGVDLHMALLLGLLCGIAERALAGAVSQRAREVVERVGGSPSVPPTQMAAQTSISTK